MGEHIIDGEFQSDKYPTCPRGKVPLSVKDPTAQDLLWEYAQRRRAVDAEFAADLEACLTSAGYVDRSARAASGRRRHRTSRTRSAVLGLSHADRLALSYLSGWCNANVSEVIVDPGRFGSGVAALDRLLAYPPATDLRAAIVALLDSDMPAGDLRKALAELVGRR